MANHRLGASPHKEVGKRSIRLGGHPARGGRQAFISTRGESLFFLPLRELYGQTQRCLHLPKLGKGTASDSEARTLLTPSSAHPPRAPRKPFQPISTTDREGCHVSTSPLLSATTGLHTAAGNRSAPSGGSLILEFQIFVMKKLKTLIGGFVILLLSASAFPVRNSEAAIGDEAPALVVANSAQRLSLDSLKGRWVLLSFWSAADGTSRMAQNSAASLVRNLKRSHQTAPQVELVSVNFDRSERLMREIMALDNLDPATTYRLSSPEEATAIRKAYRMKEGLRTFLLNPEGNIVAADPTPAQLSTLIS